MRSIAGTICSLMLMIGLSSCGGGSSGGGGNGGGGGGGGTAPVSNVQVLTYHNDNGRTGLNPNEATLTTTNVNSTGFGKVGSLTVSGLVDAEPLYAGNITINGTARNAVYVVTEQDVVYAFGAGHERIAER
jgi:hypothetical protein